MSALRLLGRTGAAVTRALWTGDLATKLSVIIGLAIGVGFLATIAGPVTTSLASAIVVIAFLFAVYSLLLRR